MSDYELKVSGEHLALIREIAIMYRHVIMGELGNIAHIIENIEFNDHLNLRMKLNRLNKYIQSDTNEYRIDSIIAKEIWDLLVVSILQDNQGAESTGRSGKKIELINRLAVLK